MNSFYNQSIIIQWILAFFMFSLMVALMILWILLVKTSYLLFFSVFIFIPISQFLVSPLYTLMGLYKYLSPILLAVNASDKKYDMHNGTTFDYLFVMRSIKPGALWKKAMLIYYLDGLLEIIRRVEENEIPDTVEVKGSSYFFSERTAQNLGFEIKNAGSFEKFNLLLNYLDLFWTYSVSRGKLSFPNLLNTLTASTNGRLLVQHKPNILRYKSIIEGASLS